MTNGVSCRGSPDKKGGKYDLRPRPSTKSISKSKSNRLAMLLQSLQTRQNGWQSMVLLQYIRRMLDQMATLQMERQVVQQEIMDVNCQTVMDMDT
jgi:hypothetical protein